MWNWENHAVTIQVPNQEIDICSYAETLEKTVYFTSQEGVDISWLTPTEDSKKKAVTALLYVRSRDTAYFPVFVPLWLQVM